MTALSNHDPNRDPVSRSPKPTLPKKPGLSIGPFLSVAAEAAQTFETPIAICMRTSEERGDSPIFFKNLTLQEALDTKAEIIQIVLPSDATIVARATKKLPAETIAILNKIPGGEALGN